MIVKDIERTRPELGTTVGIEGARRAASRSVVTILSYITNSHLHLEPLPEKARHEFDSDAEARKYEQALTSYLLAEKPDQAGRVGAMAIEWSGGQDVSAEEFLERSLFAMVSVDPSHFRHHVFSERHADIDRVVKGVGGHDKDRPWARGAEVSELSVALRDLYGPKAAIMVVEHIDSGHRHFHVAVVTVDPETGRGFQLNKGFDREPLHMVAARLDFETGAASEPNALFVASQDGIFDRWTGRRVADYQLKIDNKALMQTRRDRQAMLSNLDALDHVPGWRKRIEEVAELEQELPPPPPLGDEQVVKIMARPRITSAQSWQQLHDNLAMVGIRYRPHGGGAALVLGEESAIKATAAVSTASLTELQRRLGQYQVPQRSDNVREFVRPNFTMDKSRELERELRAIEDDEWALERKALKAKQAAAEAAIKAEKDDRSERVQIEALRRLNDVAKMALHEAKSPRRRYQKRAAPGRTTDCEGIIWSGHLSRLDMMMEMRTAYERKQLAGMITWSRNGSTEIYEHRSHLSISRGADKRQVLRLAFLKFGQNFDMLASWADLEAYTRIAAEEGILFGNAAQQARIRQMQGEARRKRERDEASAIAAQRAKRAKLYSDEQDRQVLATLQVWHRNCAAADERLQKEETRAKRSGTAHFLQPARQYEPNDKRAMQAYQKNRDDIRAHIIDWRHSPFGADNPALVEAMQQWPRDIEAPWLKAKLMADTLRQQAERDIMLRWRGQGRIETDWQDTLIGKAPAEWVPKAWDRELRNPAFLRQIGDKQADANAVDDPDIGALVLAMSTHYYGHDMAAVCAELAGIIRQKHGVIGGQAYGRLLKDLETKLRQQVCDHVAQASAVPRGSTPTFGPGR
jgi:hypothetical protein